MTSSTQQSAPTWWVNTKRLPAPMQRRPPVPVWSIVHSYLFYIFYTLWIHLQVRTGRHRRDVLRRCALPAFHRFVTESLPLVYRMMVRFSVLILFTATVRNYGRRQGDAARTIVACASSNFSKKNVYKTMWPGSPNFRPRNGPSKMPFITKCG